MKKKSSTRRIERVIYLRGKGTDRTVAIERPQGRKMVERTYKPTAASLKRVKRLMGYPCCGSTSTYYYTMSKTGYTIHGAIETEYWCYL